MLKALYFSIKPVEIPVNGNCINPLKKRIPQFPNFAYDPLGIYPTPIHKATLHNTLEFWIKREDLSSNCYGGNKTRSLQFQLPSVKLQKSESPSKKIYVIGSAGSNQVPAAICHGLKSNLDINAIYIKEDSPDLDNTLNMLSTLSMTRSIIYWDKGWELIFYIFKAILKKDLIFGPGGNSLGGALGQMCSMLELAEQIEKKEVVDINCIYLPMGSACTTTGLILGVCLSRKLGLKAFPKDFKIVSVCVHDGMAKIHNKYGFLKSRFSQYVSLTPLFGIMNVCKEFRKWCGIDLQEDAIDFFNNHWEAVSDIEYVGNYGSHSKKSKIAAEIDTQIKVTGEFPEWCKDKVPWFCGHFSAKPLAVLLDRLESKQDGDQVMFWATKSIIQPLGRLEEWEEFCNVARTIKGVQKWSEGKGYSKLRQGKVDVKNGTKDDYRHLMKQVYC
jgi:1-aminocyclopropane-1-carboxylate deaminase/D-cysteine desulfhydrase-like pyridoxal-dependent ACC family enzyme